MCCHLEIQKNKKSRKKRGNIWHQDLTCNGVFLTSEGSISPLSRCSFSLDNPGMEFSKHIEEQGETIDHFMKVLLKCEVAENRFLWPIFL